MSDLIGPRFKVPVLVLRRAPGARPAAARRPGGRRAPRPHAARRRGRGHRGRAERGAVARVRRSGLLTDLLFLETPLGLSAMVYCLVGYGVGLLQAGVLRSSWWLPS